MEILTHPNPVLKQRAAEVDPVSDPELLALIDRMATAMYEAPGVGLAAPQIGVQKRVIVYDLDDELVALCNPRIVASSDEAVTEDEGCLSVPGIAVPVPRAVNLTCEAVTPRGEVVTIEAEGLLARVLQHETDHLDGILILDRASGEDRKRAVREYNDSLHALR